MREVLRDYERLARAGEPVGRAVVTAVFGSAPRPPGATLLVAASGLTAGSVTGGCVEAAAAAEVAAAMAAGAPRRVTMGVTDAQAWEVGLACGGTLELWVEPRVRPEVLAAARGDAGRVVATVLDGAGAAGASLTVHEDGSVQGPRAPEGVGEEAATATLGEIGQEIVRAALEALEREAGGTRTFTTASGDLAVFLEVFPRPPRLVVFGGVHVAAELVPMARRLGFTTFVADGRPALLTRERFPDAHELVAAWPEEAFARIGLDRSTYVCVLTHDPKFDDPALVAALRSPARYVGAIGSRRTQAARRERLLAAGLSEEEVARLRGPVGLDLGGRQPAETALAIVAEMTAVRYGRSGDPLRATPAADPAGASRSSSAAVSR